MHQRFCIFYNSCPKFAFMDPKCSNAVQTASKSPRGGVCVLVIDQQVDFHPGGSLAIQNAGEDAERTAEFITANQQDVSQIVLTMDSHQQYHIAHGVFWANSKNECPEPFTQITELDIRNGVWVPRQIELREYAMYYTRNLEKHGKFVLCIWPEHCVIGTPGHNIVSVIHKAALNWSKNRLRPIQYVMKGTNSFTEHYSALRSEVEIPFDSSTRLNQDLVDNLKRADRIVICGEASSHCVAHTVRDLIDCWPRDRIRDLYLFSDCVSPVPGCEEIAEEFLSQFGKEGVNVLPSRNYNRISTSAS
uniref:Uncharacterized protein AlNc14C21G2166 n=1 Tax=Albugo laibachii Nc14 TaxID=890382 RepID=F0W5K1_9STRA|nr:conserved hypothetical protein [Albugo laibachii Nc14]|eukprot:CCA16392.1 conserved hypothetical protein [Albugo laibachii Nc14]